ncbi:MAG: hypothetical protein ACJ78Q_07800 [Chloroflexia bacterium]
MKTIISGLLVLCLAAVSLPGAQVEALGTQLALQTGCRLFPETGKSVCDRFLVYWNEHGGLAQQGFPITGRFSEVSEVDGKTYTVQYFERAVFELHPENRPPYDVLLSLLGAAYYKQRYPGGAPELPAGSGSGATRYFPQTGKEVRGVFLDYWQSHGGLAQQGYPITNLLRERSALDGHEYTVQYFERAVFELHPEKAPPYNVLLSQLGTLQLKRKYPGGDPAAPSGDAWAALRARPVQLPAVAPGGPCPTARGKQVNPAYGLALGDGPAYPVGLGPEGIYYYGGATQEGGWWYLKVLWVVSPDYRGPTLVRGGRIDAPGELRFERGADPPSELRLDTTQAAAGTWSDFPTYTRLRAPGCYAYQVDGTGFTRTIVFKAVDGPPPPAGP